MNPEILALIEAERTRQDRGWGESIGRRYSMYAWLAVLVEETGEVAKALLEVGSKNGVADLEVEIVQVAAVAVAMLEVLRGSSEFARAEALRFPQISHLAAFTNAKPWQADGPDPRD
jgi:NTP pyrophosphatase (non-canonical NTP hydrolase)